MAGNPNGRLKVAFVSDYLQATKDDKDFLAIRSGDFSTKIVQDALLFTPDFAQRESADLEGVKELLRSSVGATTFNLSREVTEWWKPYEVIGHWIETFNGNKPLLSNNITLDQIIKRITTTTSITPRNQRAWHWCSRSVRIRIRSCVRWTSARTTFSRRWNGARVIRPTPRHHASSANHVPRVYRFEPAEQVAA